jgi:hypothetical protein
MSIESELDKAKATVTRLANKVAQRATGNSSWWTSSKFLVAVGSIIAIWVAGNLMPAHILYCLTAIVVSYLFSRSWETQATAHRDGLIAKLNNEEEMTKLSMLQELVNKGLATTDERTTLSRRLES